MSNSERQIKQRGSTELICTVCGTLFSRPNAHIRGQTVTCSRECSYKAKPKKQKTMLDCTCKECGNQFQIRKGRGGTGEYCSITCMAAARGRSMRKENHPKWQGGTSSRSYASRKTIATIIAERGCCADCGSKNTLQGHHIKSHSAAPTLRADPANIEVLCVKCHALKHPKLAKFILAGHTHA